MTPDLMPLLDTLQELDLFEPHLLRKVETLLQDSADRPSAIRELVRGGYLTTFQANAVNQGKAKTLLVGPYVLLQRLGTGGIGEVYQARHRHIRTRTAALKVIRADRLNHPHATRQLLARFEREPEVIARLSHPNIVKVFDAGRDGDQFYLVMEHLEGTDLQKWAKDAPLPVPKACDAIFQAAQGLHHLQQRGMVHRDIKPANLFMTTEGAIKILDLGLVLLRDAEGNQETVDELTGSGAGLGTPAYWAPEQALNPHQLDIRADIYSLGRTFYYLLAGKAPSSDHAPFSTPDLQKSRPDMPRALAEILVKMTAQPEPQQRFASPVEVAAALASYCGRSAPTTALITLPPKWRMPIVIAGGLAMSALLILVLLTAGRMFWGRDDANLHAEVPDNAKPQKPDPDPKSQGNEKPQVPDQNPPATNPPKDKVAPLVPVKVVTEKAGALGKSRVLTRHTKEVVSVAFVPGKRQALSCSMNEVIWWDLQKDEEIKRKGLMDQIPFPKIEDFKPGKGFPGPRGLDSLAERSPMGAVAVEPNGKLALLGGTSHLTVWDLAGWKKQHAFTLPHNGAYSVSIGVSPDGRFAFHGNWDNLIRLYELEKKKDFTRAFPGSIACFSADGQKILTGSRSQAIRDVVKLRLFEVHTGQPIKTFGDHLQGIQALALSPDGKYALSVAVKDPEPILWDLETYSEVRRFKGHTGPVQCLAFSSDGTKILTGSDDTTARLWNVASAKELDQFTFHSQKVQAVAFSPGDNYALTGGDDQMMGIWELKK